MKSGSRTYLAGVICFLLALSFPNRAQADEIPWRRNPQEAQKEAQQSARPLLIYVDADFCGYCRKLERATWADRGVARTIVTGFVPLNLDGIHDGEFARRLGVRGFPAVILLSPSGQVLGRADGYRGPAEMQTFLARYARLDGERMFAGHHPVPASGSPSAP